MIDTCVFGGTGFIGNRFCDLYGGIKIPKDQRNPETNNILYFISTTTNYNIHENLYIDINTNLNILMEVLEHCKNQDIIFNFISSGFVYGQEVINAKESDYCNPKGFYSITKRTAEQMLITFCETFDIQYRIFRLANVYGLDKNCSSKKNILGYIVNKLKTNYPIDLYYQGNFKRDFIYVDDVCNAINFLMKNSKTNQIYNISSGIPVKFKYAVNYCKYILNSTSEINYIDDYVSDYYLNITKIKSMGFTPKISLIEGLRLICEI